jgi:hypothetical protein
MSTLDMILWILATLFFGIAAFGGARIPTTWPHFGWLGAGLIGLSVILPG